MGKNKSSHARAHRRYINKPPTDLEAQNALANEMIQWVARQDSFALEEFPISKRMAPSRFYQCAEDNEYFADALDFARYSISSRLQKGLRTKELEKDYVLRMLPLYNQEYKALIIDKVRQLQEQRQQKIFVIVDEIPKTDQVPARINS